MYSGIIAHNPSSKGNSSKGFVEYLLKEEKEKEQGHFFNENNDIKYDEVIEKLDNNRGKLKLKEANFYQISLNPSKKELEHLSKLAENSLKKNGINKEHINYEKGKDKLIELMLKHYTNQSMNQYAKNFEQTKKDGSKIEKKDLVWYAKMERNRTYKETDKAVKINEKIVKELKELNGKNKKKNIEKLESQFVRNSKGNVIKRGYLKEGLNYHIHVLVSRNTNEENRDNKVRLSPLTNVKRGTIKKTQYYLNGKKVPKKEVENHLKNNKIDKKPNDLTKESLNKLGLTKEVTEIKSGFKRTDFLEKNEIVFDKIFDYDRKESEKFRTKNANYKSRLNINKGIQNTIKSNLTKDAKREILGDLQRINITASVKQNIKNNIKMTVSKDLGLDNPIIKSIPKKIPKNSVELIVKGLKKVVEISKDLGR